MGDSRYVLCDRFEFGGIRLLRWDFFMSKGTCRTLATSPEPPLMWKLAHGMFDPETSMAEKLPRVADPIPIAPPVQGVVETSTLSNGLRVASQDNGGPVSALGLFVAAGSRHETPYSAGVSHMLEHLAFKGSANGSKFRMVRDMERTGAAFAAAASREALSYTVEGLREQVPHMIPIIADTALAPAGAVDAMGGVDWDAAMEEIHTQVAVIKEEIKTVQADPAAVVTEKLHAAAFHGNTLGMFAAYALSLGHLR